MTLLKVPKGRTVIGIVFEVLLEELKPRAVFFDDLTPGFDANGDIILSINKSAVSIRTTLDHAIGVLGHLVRDGPEVPTHAWNRLKAFIGCHRHRILYGLSGLLVAD